MQDRRSLASLNQPVGRILRRGRAVLLRDLGPATGLGNNGLTWHPRTYPPFAPARIWDVDDEYEPIADADPADVFAITGVTVGDNADITIASSDDSIFLEHDLWAIRASSGVASAEDGINNRQGRCRADATIAGGVMTVKTDRTLFTAADLGELVRLVPPPRLIGRVVQVANRWHDATLTEGMIVSIVQEDDSEWWDIVSASCGPLEDA